MTDNDKISFKSIVNSELMTQLVFKINKIGLV